MTRARRLGVVPLLLGAVVASDAHGAYYGTGATVVSASLSKRELGDDRSLAADVSEQGRHVAFDTRATNFFADDDPDAEVDGRPTDRLGGIFVRDLGSGALTLAADGDVVDQADGTLLVRGARNPSISADGRFVAFSTAQSLVPQDPEAPRHVDVYVRDMAVPLCRPLPGCAPNPYTLVSARDGDDDPLVYAEPAAPVEAGNNGAELTPLTALSADGGRVAFRTVAASDAGEAGQLLVRDIASRRTTLVTEVREGEPGAGTPAGGALGPATLSGDGTAVAWVGRNADVQTRFQPGEQNDRILNFYLYRRLPDGPTRRITGMADPDDPACDPTTFVDQGNQSGTGPCYGPLQAYEEASGSIFGTPVTMSRDGNDVAFITATAARGSRQVEGTVLDLFVTSMREGVSRKAGTVELTREGVGDQNASPAISGVAMSADGRYLALATARTRFLLPALRLVGGVRGVARTQDLYLADRQAGTVERVLLDAGGSDPDGDVDTGLSVSDGATRVAFTSVTPDLFAGDANQRADAFVITAQERPRFEEPPPEPVPAEAAVEAEPIPDVPVLSVRVLRAARTGERVLDVRPPAAGTLAATVTGRLPGKDGRRRANARVQTLSRGKGRARRREAVKVTVKLSKSRRALLRKVRSLDTTALVQWTPDDRRQAPLRRRVTVRFVVVAKQKTKKRATTKRRRKGPAGGRG